MVRNPISWRDRLERLRGSKVRLDLSSWDEPLATIQSWIRELSGTSDQDLLARAATLRDRVQAGEPLEEVRAEAYALTAIATRRTLGFDLHDVQIVAGLALGEKSVVEMQTGEGKTLAAVLPVSLHALAGRGAHVLTFNDYLASRDAAWMGPIYALLGLEVGHITNASTRRERREAYASDVTYVTAKEAGFDFLRDLLAREHQSLVHRPFHFALVDEADSLLIDEARVPLVIAGDSDTRSERAVELAALAAGLERGVHYDTDEYGRDVEMTELGLDRVERVLGCGSLVDEKNHHLLTQINCALHALVLLQKGTDYIVRDQRLELVDEFTGRVVDDRHWPDGLQAALEAKEGLSIRSGGKVLGSITLQHFLDHYSQLSGMTGTARTAAAELDEFYDLDVVVVPTHRPMIRVDHPDQVFTHCEAKEDAVIAEVLAAHSSRRPILAGTLTVTESQRIADRLIEAGVPCRILNAENDTEEAAIVAEAGALDAVTIATNMAGRGTDIVLGGRDGRDRDAVVRLGGLLVIGTNRNESRRIDLQLIGRAGRQGDPGESRFFLSLEDDLAVRFGIDDLLPAALIPERRAEPIHTPVVRAELARVQRIIEGQNLEIRRTLWRYASALEDQRKEIHARRQDLLLGCRLPETWQSSDRHAKLVAILGEQSVAAAELVVTLHHLDRLWSQHLTLVTDIREGSHLLTLGGRDPLTNFKMETSEAFHELDDRLEAAVLESLEKVQVVDGELDLEALEIRGPSATWTYLINDDPFRNQLGMLLTGPGQGGAIAAAIYAPFLFIPWILVESVFRKRARRK